MQKRDEAYYMRTTFLFGAKYERVNRYLIYARDKWRCYICRGKVQAKRVNVANQATLDHVRPISHGGSHTYDNLKTCCRSCNLKKGNND